MQKPKTPKPPKQPPAGKASPPPHPTPAGNKVSQPTPVVHSDPAVLALLQKLVDRTNPEPKTSNKEKQSNVSIDQEPAVNVQPSNQLSADMIADAILRAQEAKHSQSHIFPSLQQHTESSMITVNAAHAQQNRLYAAQSTQTPALYQYHLLVNEQELVRQQQMQRNNFMRMAMYSGIY